MNKTKIKPKLILGAVVVILFFSLLPGALAAKSEKWDFDAVAAETYRETRDVWMSGNILHIRLYKENTLTGFINGVPFTGYTVEILHIKMDPVTFADFTANGKLTFHISELGVTFYGPVNVKMVAGEMDGKCALQGTGEFYRWKLFGIVWNNPDWTNGLSGIILIPN